MLPGIAPALLFGSGVPAKPLVARSLRFNSNKDTSLYAPTPGPRTSAAKCTTSFWVKRALRFAANSQQIFSCYDNSSPISADIMFNASNQLVFNTGYANSGTYVTTAAFNDYNRWMHVVTVYDNTVAPYAFIYVDGVLQAASGPTTNVGHMFMYPNTLNRIGDVWGNQYDGYNFDGYLTEFHHIDGQNVPPSAFGETVAGKWQPKAYTGTYGSTGFYLKLSDNGPADLVVANLNGSLVNSVPMQNLTLGMQGTAAFASTGPAPKFGSAYISNGSGGCVFVNGHQELNSLGEFTVDFWSYGVTPWFTTDSGAVYAYLLIYGATFYMSWGRGSWDLINAGSTGWTGPAGVWTHYAIVRDAEKISFYQDGVRTGSYALSWNYHTGASGNWLFGNCQGTYSANSRFDGIRICKAARWMANFTPPTVEAVPTVSRGVSADNSGMSNLFTYSDLFSNAYWAKGNNAAVVSGQVDPFGGTGAFSLVVGSATASPYLNVAYTYAAADLATFTVHAKAAALSTLAMINGNTNGGRASFNLLTGAVISSSNTGTGTGVVASIAPASTPLGGGKSAVSFIGTNYLKSSAAMTGAADGKLASFSVWIRRSDATIGGRIICPSVTLGGGETTTTRLIVAAAGSGPFQLVAANAAGSSLGNIESLSSVPIGVWTHYCGMMDLTDTTKCKLYQNGVDVTTSSAALVNDVIDFTYADWGIGARPDGSALLNADLAELWFAPGQWIDFRVQANRDKFMLNGTPVDLGAAGATPTGTSPLIFMSGDASTWATNKGIGGGFTKVGALAAPVEWYKCSVATRHGTAGADATYLMSQDPSTVNGQGIVISRASLVNGSAVPRELQYTNGAAVINKDWRTIGISVTEPFTYNDSLVDVPYNPGIGIDTGNGGEIFSNYAVFNPADRSSIYVYYGGLYVVGAVTSAWHDIRTTVSVPGTGHWWCEFDLWSMPEPGHCMIGISDETEALPPNYPGYTTKSASYYCYSGNYVSNNGAQAAYGPASRTGDQIGLRLQNGSLYFYRRAGRAGPWVLMGSGAVSTGWTGKYKICVGMYDGYGVFANFGQAPWVTALPVAGAKAICLLNTG